MLILVNPVFTFVFPPGFSPRAIVTLAFGFTSMAIGFVLISPAVVVFVDRWISPLLACVLRIDPRLLASQITNNIWRTVGTAISTAIGMGLYVGIFVWGFTMLEAFIPGSWAPDALIAAEKAGLSPQMVSQIREIPGVDPNRCQPIVVEQPRLFEDITGSAERASVTRQDDVVIVGIDPQDAFAGSNPLFELDWVEGSPREAIQMMKEGRGCVVPDHFVQETGLGVGDSFALVPPEGSDRPVTYTIAGAVRLPGWHWQTKRSGFRSRTHRAAALVFADYASVAEDFQKPNPTYV